MELLVNIFNPVPAFQPNEKELTTFEQLTNSFKAHERDEQRFLEEYRDIVERHENPLMRFLLQMIMSKFLQGRKLLSLVQHAEQEGCDNVVEMPVREPCLEHVHLEEIDPQS